MMQSPSMSIVKVLYVQGLVVHGTHSDDRTVDLTLIHMFDRFSSL
jgi:hypothetical protein